MKVTLTKHRAGEKRPGRGYYEKHTWVCWLSSGDDCAPTVFLEFYTERRAHKFIGRVFREFEDVTLTIS